MQITYTEARRRIAAIASEQRNDFLLSGDIVPLADAVGRVVKTSVFSPISTPTFDASAMDGFAVCSALTASASHENPLLLRVVGCIVAGDATSHFDAGVVDGVIPCVEIMTGAAFPLSRSEHRQFDACIPREHTRQVLHPSPDALHGAELISIQHPVELNQHRRLAGGDYCKGDLIADQGVVINTRHIMAAASVGITSFECFRRVRVGVLSTGSELFQGAKYQNRGSHGSQIPDVNAPYLLAMIRELGADGQFLGTVVDDSTQTSNHIRKAIKSASFDIIVSSGAVSAGKMDLMPEVLSSLQADIQFHHVAMRPGHPVLVATIPVSSRTDDILSSTVENGCRGRSRITFFGLPGNPIAAAACFRFLLMPYYRCLISAPQVPCTTATMKQNSREPENECSTGRARSLIFSNPKQLDQFRHGCVQTVEGKFFAQFSTQQSPAKISPFTGANCWIHVPWHTVDVFAGDHLKVYSLDDFSLPGCERALR